MLVDLWLLSELTEKLPGKCGSPSLQKVYLEVCSTRWPVGGQFPWPQCQGKDQKNDTKVKKTLCPLEELEDVAESKSACPARTKTWV